jgi:hypothetical protein
MIPSLCQKKSNLYYKDSTPSSREKALTIILDKMIKNLDAISP